MEVGKKLHKLREDKKMSMYRLTQLTGVSGHHIKGIVEDTRQPTIETLNRLAVALGSSLAEMFNDDTDVDSDIPKQRTAVKSGKISITGLQLTVCHKVFCSNRSNSLLNSTITKSLGSTKHGGK